MQFLARTVIRSARAAAESYARRRSVATATHGAVRSYGKQRPGAAVRGFHAGHVVSSEDVKLLRKIQADLQMVMVKMDEIAAEKRAAQRRIFTNVVGCVLAGIVFRIMVDSTTSRDTKK